MIRVTRYMYNTTTRGAARLATVCLREFDLKRNSTFWIDLYDITPERYASSVADILGDVPGVYDGRSGYSTGAHRGRVPHPKWIHPDWRGPGNDGWNDQPISAY